MTLILAVLGLAALAAVLHHSFSAGLAPKHLVEFLSSKELMRSDGDLRFLAIIYYAFVFAGGYLILFSGFKLFLFWIPALPSWLQGEHPLSVIQSVAATFLALLVVPWIAFVEGAAHDKIRLEMLRTKVKKLEKDLAISSREA